MIEVLQVEEKYLIHDNGGRPFNVVIQDDIVSIYVLVRHSHISTVAYKHFKDFKATKIFIGFDGSENPEGTLRLLPQKDGKYRGNSILLQVDKNEYVFIGKKIYSFKTDEEIVHYYSQIGNSNVPYPVAMGKENIYFMLDRKYVKKDKFRKCIDWEDAYYSYYGHDGTVIKDEDKKLMKSVKTIHKRLW